MFLVVLQVVHAIVVDVTGAVRSAFPVIVLFLVSEWQLLLAVDQNRPGVQFLSHVVVRQTRRGRYQYLATDLYMVVVVVVMMMMMILEAYHETTGWVDRVLS